jgi:hypothetical protein
LKLWRNKIEIAINNAQQAGGTAAIRVISMGEPNPIIQKEPLRVNNYTVTRIVHQSIDLQEVLKTLKQ